LSLENLAIKSTVTNLFSGDDTVARPKSKQGPKPERENVELGVKLQVIRKRRGLSQAELGEKIGLSQRAVSAYEGGYNRISAPVLLKLAEALRTSIPELLGKKQTSVAVSDKQVARLLDSVERLPPRKRRQVEEYVAFIAKG
jgi:transcriptional regulator with XRE-family HTH domain